MGWSHLLPEHLQASEAVQEEAPGAHAMEKMQTTFQRKHGGIFKSRKLLLFLLPKFPCFPGCILKEKLNDQEKVLLAAQRSTCSS